MTTKRFERGFICPEATLVLNNILGCRKGVDLELEPLESPLYQTIIAKLTGLEAVVMIPPAEFRDLAFVTAMEFATQAVCMQVHRNWLVNAHIYRQQLIKALEDEGRLLLIHQRSPEPDLCWVCAFDSSTRKAAMMRPGFDKHSANAWVELTPSSESTDLH